MNTLASFFFDVELFAVAVVGGAVGSMIGLAWLSRRHAALVARIEALAKAIADHLP